MGATSFANVTSVSRSASAALAGNAASPAAASTATTSSIFTEPGAIAFLATARAFLAVEVGRRRQNRQFSYERGPQSSDRSRPGPADATITVARTGREKE